MFGADRALLLTEAVLLAKLVMVAAGYPFVLAGRGCAPAGAGAEPFPRLVCSSLTGSRREAIRLGISDGFPKFLCPSPGKPGRSDDLTCLYSIRSLLPGRQ